jgi:hypothetical protein
MAKGGKRPGAGAKKGQPQKRTVEKLERERQFRERIAERLEQLAGALLAKAEGVSHLQAKDTATGQWMSVKDPTQMTAVLNGPAEYQRIFAEDPDIRAIKECLDRLFGQPTQHVEVEPVVSPDNMTDEELKAKAEALLAMLS